MDSKAIRQSFISFFKDKGHQFVRSAPVAPLDDPTLLFTNAGMNQFKPIFLDEQPIKYQRVVDSQKCIRVSGKHNDLEEVGVDNFHHTFFEMLGNWSFGDYYKAEAIRWAWELLTEVWKLDKQRLWATVYSDDDKAFELWKSETDIPHHRILRFGKKENFWEMGETGPCGPCSEIHYYVGDDLTKQTADGVNVTNDYWELWNLVFIQYNRSETGKLSELPKKHIDTGAGLERIVAVMQNKTSNYDTDLFQPIIRNIEKLTGISARKNPVPFQVIADHVRMLTFAIADGAMPSNEGRGYVLRRVLRRASRFGRMLNQHKPFIYKLVDVLGDLMGDVYPEILDKRTHITNVIKAEETAFNETLDRGLNHLDKVITGFSGKVISGTEAFRLYDTYGFPLDLTQLIARENGFCVDEIAFKEEMEKQKKRAKASGKFKRQTSKLDWNIIQESDDSEFLGYDSIESNSNIVHWANTADGIALVLDKTPFYAESGGQINDTGTIIGNGINLTVIDVQKDNDRFIHYCIGSFALFKTSNPVHCKIDVERRDAIKRNHTATHLLHAALKEILGDHVHQAGSSVGTDNLRFDLTHFDKITAKEITQIEMIVNQQIINNIKVNATIKSFDDAKKAGAEALFGEKYGDEVRVLTIGKFSKELCGGTHVNRTGDIGFFKITEESSLATGVRRIVAITGMESVKMIQNQSDILSNMQNILRSSQDKLVERTEQIIAQRKDFEKQLKRRSVVKEFRAKMLVTGAIKVGDKQIVVSQVKAQDIDELKHMGDELLSVMKSGIGVLGSKSDGKPGLVVIVSPDLVKLDVNAGNIAKEIGLLLGGGGGGKPHLATAGGKENVNFDETFKKIIILLRSKLDKL